MANPEHKKKKLAQLSKRYHSMTPEQKRTRRLQSIAAWKERDPQGYQQYRKAKRARHRHRRRQATGGHTLADVRLIYRAQKGKCAYFRVCGNRLGDDYHEDHIVSISCGGTDDANNIQLTCPACNWSKNDRHPVDFAQSLGLLI